MQEARQASEEANRRLAEIEHPPFPAGFGNRPGLREAAEKERSRRRSADQRLPATEDARMIVQSAEQEIAAAAKTARRELTASCGQSCGCAWRPSRSRWTRLRIRRWCEVSPKELGAETRQGRELAMASVTSTYARALADVVFDQHLDPERRGGGAKSLAALVAESQQLREVWEAPSSLAQVHRLMASCWGYRTAGEIFWQC